MRLLRGLNNIPSDFRGCVATIGNFDGLHLGHQAILDSLNEAAEATGLPTLVMLFEPQPKEFFAPDKAPARLASLREKILDLKQAGVDYVLCLSFGQQLRSMTADAFIDRILVDALAVKHLIVGDDFRFGCDRSGDFAALSAAGSIHGFGVEDTPTYELDGDRVSSTRVRGELARAELASVQQLIGRFYRMNGRVVFGRQLGRLMQTPTANVRIDRRNLPMRGVFAVDAVLQESGERFNGVANLGIKPSITEKPEPSLEVHLFDFSGDLYGKHLEVTFLSRLREEQRFYSLEALGAAIEQDKTNARAWFARR
ncbi:MAG: bifunctional riboflavin kinase/FMN adenylyltransferase [Oceanospirillaceae bacterium]|nr:bifunctional riboflavin kinase/FMN adenylyltransferase [Oceanospirillaceae bacterium]